MARVLRDGTVPAGELTQADVLQVVERLFALLSDCMWEAPVAQAKHSVQIKEKVQELKLQVWRRPLPPF